MHNHIEHTTTSTTKMVEFHVVLFLLSFALVWKIVYIALIIDDGENYRNIINIIGDICILCVGMRFVWVSYHKSISEKLDKTIETINKSIEANETLIKAIKEQGETLSKVVKKNTTKNKTQRKLYKDDIERISRKMVSIQNSVDNLDGSMESLGERVRTELRTISSVK